MRLDITRFVKSINVQGGSLFLLIMGLAKLTQEPFEFKQNVILF